MVYPALIVPRTRANHSAWVRRGAEEIAPSGCEQIGAICITDKPRRLNNQINADSFYGLESYGVMFAGRFLATEAIHHAKFTF